MMRSIKLYPHQEEAVSAILSEFNNGASRCNVVMACGTGKTFTAISLVEELKPRSVVVFVPSLALISQFMKSWIKECTVDSEFLAVCSEKKLAQSIEDESLLLEVIDFPVTREVEEINGFVSSKSDKMKVIFCTYQSSNLLEGHHIELGIFDEAHKTSGYDKTLFYKPLVDDEIRIDKRLFVTATPRYGRVSKNRDGTEKTLFSMDDENVYGRRAYTLNFRDAIKRGLITDYKVIISVIDTNKDNEHAFGSDFEVQEKAIAITKAIEETQSKKIITFHSSINSADSFTNYYKEVCPEGLSVHHISSNMSIQARSDTLEWFRKSNFSLISNARCLTEGVDIPSVDMVAFMNPRTSKIDIVQAIGRAIRNAPGKKTGYIFLPLFIDENGMEDADHTAYGPIWQVLKSLIDQDSDLEDVVRNLLTNAGGEWGKCDLSALDQHINVISNSDVLKQLIKVKIIEKVSDGWYIRYGQLIKFKEEFGHCCVNKDYHIKELHGWRHAQMRARNKFKTLSKEKEKLLNDIGFSWNKIEEAWDMYYSEALGFYREHGHIQIPSNISPKLYAWLHAQKVSFKKGRLSPIRTQKLKDLGYDIERIPKLTDRWEKGLQELINHIEKGFYKLDWGFLTITTPSPYLKAWLNEQRKYARQGKLEQSCINELKKLNISLNPEDDRWNYMFELYKKKQKTGHVRKWGDDQRRSFRNGCMTSDKKQLLECIGFKFAENTNELDSEKPIKKRA